MGTRIVTYQSPNGATISLTREDVATLRLLGVWPRDAKGAEYCTVSHGERYGWQSAEDAAKVRETVGGARLNGKHTPGPWVVGDGAICGGEYGGTMVCEHPRRGWERLDAASAGAGRVLAKMLPESDANARLISAAPDMLEALRSAVALLTDPDAGEFEANDVLGELEAAIRKATGGEGGAS